MRKILWIFIVMIVCMTAACTNEESQKKSIKKSTPIKNVSIKNDIVRIKSIDYYPEQTWTNVKSPISGRCYEVLLFQDWDNIGGYGFMGMSQIPCEKDR